MTYDLAIVGGGIAGLSAAWYAQKQSLRYLLLEASDYLGGKVRSDVVHVDDLSDPFIVEFGPDGFITRKPWALELVSELGLDVQPVKKLPERIYVLSNRKLHPLPEGLYLLVPTQIQAFIKSGLFSPWGKLRVLVESLIPAKSDDADESLAQFVRRRLGAEALDKLGEPMLAGVYNANAEEQSILATFPQFRALEREHGSLIRGMQARQNPESDAGPVLVSLLNGMGDLSSTIVEKLTGDIRTSAPVSKLLNTTSGYKVVYGDSTVEVSAVVLTTSSTLSANLLQEIAPESADHLKRIRYAGVGSVSLAYQIEDIPTPLDAFGVVIPSSENRQIDGITFSSAKWNQRAPAGHALIRVFFGGPHTRHMLTYTEDQIIETICDELRDLLGIAANPIFTRMAQWPDGYPQYDVGHLELVKDIEQSLPSGIYVTGSPYRGVGLPDIVRTSRDLIKRIYEEKKNGVVI